MIRLSPAARMTRALVASAARFGLHLTIAEIAERPWYSATFAGWRLDITVQATGGDPADWLAALPEEELTLPGLLVADIAVIAASANPTRLEALVLDP